MQPQLLADSALPYIERDRISLNLCTSSAYSTCAHGCLYFSTSKQFKVERLTCTDFSMSPTNYTLALGLDGIDLVHAKYTPVGRVCP